MLGRGAPARDASACGPLASPGLSLDRSRLHLLYWTPPEAAWDDITAQVALEFTHLYARFQVTHFSWSVPPAPPLSPLPTAVCAAPAHRQPSQVLALVHHQDVRGGPGSEGLGAPAAAQGQPHCPAEAPGPRAGPAAVPAPQQGGCRVRRPGGPSRRAGGLHGAVGTGLGASGCPPPRWTPPCRGCWTATGALSRPTQWRCSRAKNSLLPSRGVLPWTLVCPPHP